MITNDKLSDFEQIELAFDILQDAEIVQEFEHEYWVKVDKESFDQLRVQL
jgi:hypothetical protein